MPLLPPQQAENRVNPSCPGRLEGTSGKRQENFACLSPGSPSSAPGRVSWVQQQDHSYWAPAAAQGVWGSRGVSSEFSLASPRPAELIQDHSQPPESPSLVNPRECDGLMKFSPGLNKPTHLGVSKSAGQGSRRFLASHQPRSTPALAGISQPSFCTHLQTRREQCHQSETTFSLQGGCPEA